MKNLIKIFTLALVASTQIGCSFYARSAEDYEKDTSALIAQREAEMQACYDKLLAKDRSNKGKVVVNFTVAVKTGEITDPKIDEAASTAPKAVYPCVLDSLKGLVLDPPDQREGKASYTYQFQP